MKQTTVATIYDRAWPDGWRIYAHICKPSEQIIVKAPEVDEEVQAVEEDEPNVAVAVQPQAAVYLVRPDVTGLRHAATAPETCYHLQSAETSKRHNINRHNMSRPPGELHSGTETN